MDANPIPEYVAYLRKSNGRKPIPRQRAILDDESRKTTPGPALKHLLSFLARCGGGACGGPVILTGSRGRRPVYRCRADAAGHVVRDAAAVDDYVVRIVLRRLAAGDAAGLLRRDVTGDTAALARERATAEQLMREENDLRKRGLLTSAEFAESRAGHLADVARISDQLARLTHAGVLAPLIVRFREDAPDDYEGQLLIWNDYPLERRRAVIGTLMSVRILPAGKGRPRGWQPGTPYFDPAGVEITWKQHAQGVLSCADP